MSPSSPEPGERSWREALLDRKTGWGVPGAAILEVEAQARRDALLALRETVEGLIQDAGGLCVVPSDFDPESINICATHSEIMFGDTMTCDDDPRHLRAVVSAIDRQLGEG